MSASKDRRLPLGKVVYNADWLRTVSERQALTSHHGEDPNQVRNAWKQANGKSVRKHEETKEAKPEKESSKKNGKN